MNLDPPAKGGTMAIDIDVEYEDGLTALVHFQPFDV